MESARHRRQKNGAVSGGQVGKPEPMKMVRTTFLASEKPGPFSLRATLRVWELTPRDRNSHWFLLPLTTCGW